MISIGFSTTDKILSRLVRWVTKSKASHSFIMFDWMDQKWVIESEWNGVQIVPYSSFMARKNIVVQVFDMPQLTMDDLKLVLDDTGVKYDYSGLLGAIFPMIGRWFKQKWHNPWNNSKAVFCSELIAQWLKDLDMPTADNLVPGDINPEDLMKFLEENAE